MNFLINKQLTSGPINTERKFIKLLYIIRSNSKNILFLELLNYQTKREIKLIFLKITFIVQNIVVYSQLMSNKNIQRASSYEKVSK